MNGPQHYMETERLLELAVSNSDVHKPSVYQRAQVHATLALTAATLDGAFEVGNSSEWLEVIR